MRDRKANRAFLLSSRQACPCLFFPGGQAVTGVSKRNDLDRMNSFP